jgi:hypothetical protein
VHVFDDAGAPGIIKIICEFESQPGLTLPNVIQQLAVPRRAVLPCVQVLDDAGASGIKVICKFEGQSGLHCPALKNPQLTVP